MDDTPKGKGPKTAILIKQLLAIAALLALFASILPWALGLGEKNRIEMNSFQSGQVVVIKKAIIAAASENEGQGREKAFGKLRDHGPGWIDGRKIRLGTHRHNALKPDFKAPVRKAARGLPVHPGLIMPSCCL